MLKPFFLVTLGLGLLFGMLVDDMSLGVMIGAALSIAYYLLTAENGGSQGMGWGGAGEVESCAGSGDGVSARGAD